MKNILFFVLLGCSGVASAQQNQFINPRPVGYSDAVITAGGKTIYISGQVPVNEKGELIGKGELRAQTVQVFENLKQILSQSGATFENVVKVNTYIVNCKPADVAIVREVRKSYFSPTQPPASTLVGVTSLVDPAFLIEIEVVAVIKQ
jgi:enamine deaminase RidA (YjgF/YER057c/UK114 family)